MAPGFKPTTFRTWIVTHNHHTRDPAQKFYFYFYSPIETAPSIRNEMIRFVLYKRPLSKNENTKTDFFPFEFGVNQNFSSSKLGAVNFSSNSNQTNGETTQTHWHSQLVYTHRTSHNRSHKLCAPLLHTHSVTWTSRNVTTFGKVLSLWRKIYKSLANFWRFISYLANLLHFGVNFRYCKRPKIET